MNLPPYEPPAHDPAGPLIDCVIALLGDGWSAARVILAVWSGVAAADGERALGPGASAPARLDARIVLGWLILLAAHQPSGVSVASLVKATGRPKAKVKATLEELHRSGHIRRPTYKRLYSNGYWLPVERPGAPPPLFASEEGS